ncbi:MAG: hypothetical protein ABEJ02_03620 [Candidatus Paceibacteria bacterium]
MQQLFITAIESTVIQLSGTAGIFFIFGYLFYYLQKGILKQYQKSFGWNSMMITAWIGTPIHEFGHLLFALIFNYRIKKVELFNPNKKTGRMGHVKYGYVKHSILHRFGKFFVGAGPLILGSGIILVLMYFLVPNGAEIYQTILKNSQASFLAQAQNVLVDLFAAENLTSYKFWIFTYLALSLVTHISPSKRDRSQMWSGLIWFGFILLLLNLAALAFFDINLNIYTDQLVSYMSVLTSIFIFSLLLALIHYILATLILSPFRS